MSRGGPQYQDGAFVVIHGHGRSKNGVASLAYDRWVHADRKRPHAKDVSAAPPHGLPDQVRQ
jgi:hypothetical protein